MDKFIIQAKYFDRGFQIELNKEEFQLLDNNKILVYIEPYNLNALACVIKDLTDFKTCIETKKYE